MIAVICGILFALSLVPVLQCAPFVRATGDDLGYSAGVHHALESGKGLRGLLSSVGMTVKNTWHSWQGTWSSVALFSLMPGIWGDQWYPITVAVALVCILAGSGYFLSVLCYISGWRIRDASKQKGIIGKAAFRIIFFLTAILLIQYMPNVRCGIFWWTSVAHYCIPYGVVMMCMGWSLRWLETGRRRYMTGMVIGMSYLGGAGYPEVVLGASWFFFLELGVLTGVVKVKPVKTDSRFNRNTAIDSEAEKEESGENAGENRNRTGREKSLRGRNDIVRGLWLLLPLVPEMAGFAVSAMAPGNRNRGGESFGFSLSHVGSALAASVKEGFVESLRYFITVRPLILEMLLIAAVTWFSYRPLTSSGDDPLSDEDDGGTHPDSPGNRTMLSVRHPLFLTAAGFAMICLVRAPVIYAGTDASGGVPDSYWFITLIIMTVCLMEWVCWLRDGRLYRSFEGKAAGENGKRPRRKIFGSFPEDGVSEGEKYRPQNGRHGGRRIASVFAAVGILCLLLSRHLIGNTVDYTCVNFIRSGALHDYHVQMEEWLDILNDPAVTDAKLPAMNSEQGPFMMMVPLGESGNFSNDVYERYYGKNSVVCVPRKK